MRFSSDRDGPLSGVFNAQPMSLEVSTDTLSPGLHRISFSATDSGGLTSTASITVTVTNRLRYAAKFICGKAPEESAARGAYFTAVNVHNPSDGPVSFQKRFTVGQAEQKPGSLTPFRPAQLDAGRAFRVECPEVLRTVGTSESFLEGFVVLESPDPLNVVAVYSAAGQSGFVETLHVQSVAGSRLAVKIPDLVVESGCDLKVRVRNVGAGDAPASTTKLDTGRQVFNLPTPAIPAGGVAVLPPVNAQVSGDFGFTVTADSEGRVVESSETNNVAVVNCIG
jgi:CARDB protein